MKKINKILMFLMMFVLLALSVSAQEYVDSYDINVGVYDSGDLNSFKFVDSDIFIFHEEVGTPAYDVSYTFDDVDNFKSLQISFQATGSGQTHTAEIQMFNFDTQLYQTFYEYVLEDEIETLNLVVVDSERFINDSGSVIVKTYHAPTGAGLHYLEIDRLVLLPEDEQPVEEVSFCPTTVTENLNSFLLLIIVLVVLGLGIIISNPIIGILGSVGFILYGLSIVGCFIGVGSIVMGVGVILLLYFGFLEK